ncbi:hypothetical protein BU24DRAFT_178467 [Aaosphaeria arxii CBS 175.79]|uniref:Uncharacterized protein n=1 Tax=Aaosphaeria arxii CBS 175.79 TaxID=1450172 RepID=A0A6A5XQ78_9PLEO|nr:uncharacterized protein BU24DRAFT_178467 [Aaosphaeria arxii CBS 175.79]KAF2015435.1 hypothetical protein BU24DRAFT_178467 [Aaosphaeria arxii CBS 175.79]
MGYVDTSTQTIIEGLAKHPVAVPPELQPSTPPPDAMSVKEEQKSLLTQEELLQKDKQWDDSANPTDGAPTTGLPETLPFTPTPGLASRRRPPFRARISLPELDLDTEGPSSPPPTDALMSPLPAANTLHAGHTPIIPRSLAPIHGMEPVGIIPLKQALAPEPEPDVDLALHGPLTLPARPGDGADDRIELKALDAELERIAQEQSERDDDSDEEKDTVKDITKDIPHEGSPKASAKGSRRSSADEGLETIDGILLKKPRMNMGAPLGQA